MRLGCSDYRRAPDAGVSFIDTAESYGESEDFIGRAIEGRRDRFVVASKLYTEPAGEERTQQPREHRACRSTAVSSGFAQTISIYISFIIPTRARRWMNRSPRLEVAVKRGKTRYVGVTNHYAWQYALMIELAKHLGFDPIVSLQFRYNLLDRVVENESVPMCARLTLAIMTYAPLCGGMLTGK